MLYIDKNFPPGGEQMGMDGFRCTCTPNGTCAQHDVTKRGRIVIARARQDDDDVVVAVAIRQFAWIVPRGACFVPPGRFCQPQSGKQRTARVLSSAAA